MSKQQAMQQQSRLFMAILFCLLIIVHLFSQRYTAQWDFSYQSRNSIPSATLKVLPLLPHEITFYAFTDISSEKQQVQKFLQPYRQQKRNFLISFIDPSENPSAARALDYQAETPIIIEYANKRIALRHLNKQTMHQALQQLSLNDAPWLTFSQGFGERSPYQTAPFNYTALITELDNLGYTSIAIDLRTVSTVPTNTDVLILAAPTQAYDEATLNKIVTYVEAGGQLLWLSDTDSPTFNSRLQTFFGVQLLPGILVDANSSKYIQGKPDFVPVEYYATSTLDMLREFKQVTLFPQVRGLQIVETDSVFQAAPTLQSSRSSWTETSALRGDIAFDENSEEVAGPINIGLHLTRALAAQREQRLLFLGDADFLADAYLGNGGNLDLALTLFQWLQHRDSVSHVSILRAPDKQLSLSKAGFYAINIIYLVILPLLFGALPLLIFMLLRRREQLRNHHEHT